MHVFEKTMTTRERLRAVSHLSMMTRSTVDGVFTLAKSNIPLVNKTLCYPHLLDIRGEMGGARGTQGEYTSLLTQAKG